MRKIIIRDERHIHPFNEEARDLRINNQPLWLSQRDALAKYTTQEIEVSSFDFIPQDTVESLVYRDNLFFEPKCLDAFMTAARKHGGPCRIAFSSDNKTFTQHALPLSTSYTKEGNVYLADLWYFPTGYQATAPAPYPILVSFDTREIGYYRIPTYMSTDKGELIYQVPLQGLIAIDAWVHIYIADVVYGLFGRGARVEDRANRDLLFNLRVLWRGVLEMKQVFESSELVRVGRNCQIDPAAVIKGPTTIGDNCNIGPGVVIDNCTIGDNVTISQGCQLMLSTVGDGSFLPFRASLFESTLMENVIVAQNTCLQMCVVGRRTFIGAGNTFTDYNLLPAPIRAINADGELREAGAPVLGGCVGHNCRLGSGLIIYPARTIESDVILFASKDRRVIDKNVTYEESDHHSTRAAHLHKRLYPRKGEKQLDTW
jgi:acetyltransferase-like isoleucine patch superfamily enzyme